jgi:polysaccharide export outer membrane protein
MVTGAVPVTGRIFLRGGARLKEVLSEAGGFREMSGEKITISRKREGSEEVETLHIDRREFEAGTANPAVRHGDIIDVSKAEYCYIQGEVRSPSRVPIERGTTLLQAITIVGGLTEWADRRTVTILSGEGGEARKVNLKRIQDNKEPDPVLQGGEIIVIGRRFF